MTTAATRNMQDNTPEATLFVAFELSEKTWKLGFATGHGQKPRERTMAVRQQERVLDEIAQAGLRTYDRTAEAVRVIHRALDHGVNYCDTAPAYASSMDYYGAALGERRSEIFLASKTHEHTRDGSLRLLDRSLQRLRTEHLDLWQLHDLRTTADLARIFGKGGALKALVQARKEGRVRFLGLTGHHDPAILLEAMRRFPFDTVLVAFAADVHRLSFISTVLAEAAHLGMGVIGMKVYAQGALLSREKLTADDAMGYVSLCLVSVRWLWVAAAPPRWTTTCVLPGNSVPSMHHVCTRWKRGRRGMPQRVPPIRNPADGSCSHRGDGPYDTGQPQAYRLTHKPMTMLCLCVDFEKQMV
jgi:aryl-alcohol dehydrogenase-like predicted oxidoreductase